MNSRWATAWLIGFSVIIALLAAGIILLVSSQPRGEPVRLNAPPTQPLLAIQVSGAVAHPGVYSLPPGSRVLDAIQASGGFLPSADGAMINQAAALQDGQMVWVPSVLDETESPAAPTSPAENPSRAPSIDLKYPLNINTASAEELESLPGIGPELAGRIVAYRKENGPFAAIEDIQLVDGIGPKTLEEIRELITVTAPAWNEPP